MRRIVACLGVVLLGVFGAPVEGVQEGEEVLTNAEVVALTEAGLPAALIVAKIAATRTDFDTSVEQLVSLSAAGVDAGVIEAMVAATSPSSVASVTLDSRRSANTSSRSRSPSRPSADPSVPTAFLFGFDEEAAEEFRTRCYSMRVTQELNLANVLVIRMGGQSIIEVRDWRGSWLAASVTFRQRNRMYDMCEYVIDRFPDPDEGMQLTVGDAAASVPAKDSEAPVIFVGADGGNRGGFELTDILALRYLSCDPVSDGAVRFVDARQDLSLSAADYIMVGVRGDVYAYDMMGNSVRSSVSESDVGWGGRVCDFISEVVLVDWNGRR